jgi:RNA polymerase subunit RPABC4/transcription elongation factor Spt4
MKKKACKDCKALFDEGTCPICKKDHSSTSWQGRITIIDPEHSMVAHKMGVTHKGEYAIKVR